MITEIEGLNATVTALLKRQTAYEDTIRGLTRRLKAQESAQQALQDWLAKQDEQRTSDVIECPVCQGACGVEALVEKGPKMGYEWRRCENCNGSGKVRIPGKTPPATDPEPLFHLIGVNAGFYNIAEKLLTAIRAAILDDDPLGSKVVLIEAMEPVGEELAQLGGRCDDLEALVNNITALGSRAVTPSEVAE